MGLLNWLEHKMVLRSFRSQPGDLCMISCTPGDGRGFCFRHDRTFSFPPGDRPPWNCPEGSSICVKCRRHRDEDIHKGICAFTLEAEANRWPMSLTLPPGVGNVVRIAFCKRKRCGHPKAIHGTGYDYGACEAEGCHCPSLRIEVKEET